MKICRKYLISVFMLFACTFLYGCTAQNDNDKNQGTDEIDFTEYADYEYYSVHYYNGTSEQWTMDRNGNKVPENEVKYAIRDLETDEVQAYFTAEAVDVLSDETDGYAYRKFLNTLYDVHGNILRKQAEENFIPGVGDYLLVNTAEEYMQRYLYNYKTKEIMEEVIGNIIVLGNERYLLTTVEGAPYILVDKEFNQLKKFEDDGRFYYWTRECKDGYFLSSYTTDVSNLYDNMGTTLFDNELNPVFDFTDAYSYNTNGGVIGNYIVCVFEEENLFKIADYEGNIVYEFAVGRPGVEYFDGELLITYNSLEADYKNVYTMTNILTGEVLFDKCRMVRNLDGNEEDRPAEHFMVSWGDRTAVVDRLGNILKEAPLTDISSVHVLKDNLYLLYADIGYYATKEYLVDNNFNFIIEPDKYTFITYSKDYSKKGYPNIEYLRCGYSHTLMDICNFEGEAVIENVAQVYDMGTDRISLRKGFFQGLMRYDGTWIYKESMFPKMAD